MSPEEDYDPFVHGGPEESPVVKTVLLIAAIAAAGFILCGVVSDVPKLETPPAPAMMGTAGF